MSYGSKFIAFPLPVMTGNNDLIRVVKASTKFGGMTIIAANYVPAAATDAGTSHALYLLNYGTTGTALASGGTVGSVGGTAAPYSAGVPAAFTLTTAQVFLDEGEWLVLRKTQEGADSDITTNATLVIEYCDGIVEVG